MSYEQRNRRFFEQYDPGLLKELGLKAEIPARVVPSRKGPESLIWREEHVHSAYDPRKEASKACRGASQDLHIHFGFGLGYLLEEDQSTGHVVIMEPSRDILLATFAHRDLGPLLSAKKAYLCCSEPRLRELLTHFIKPKAPVKLVGLPFHQRKWPQYWAGLGGIIDAARFDVDLARRTLRKSADLLTRGALAALPFTTRLPGVNRLFGRLTGMPAVIVSAGPSLDKNLSELAPFADRCVIFAIGRTAKPLEYRGICPHFLVHNEPKPFFQFIEGCRNLSQTAFVLSEQADLDYYRHDHGPTFVFDNPANFTGRWVKEHFPQLDWGFLATGGSVANEAFSLAVLAGCDPIVLLGQDLAVQGESYYGFGGTNLNFIHLDSDYRWTPGYFGGQAKTLTSWLSYINWFGQQASQLNVADNKVRLINATEGGAHLPGFTNLKLRESCFRFFVEPVQLAEVIAQAANLPEEDRLPEASLVELATTYRQRLVLLEKLCIAFPPFSSKLKHLLNNFSVNKMTKLQKHLTTMEEYRDAYIQAQQGFVALSGLLQADLMDIEEGGETQVDTDAESELDAFLHQTRTELERLDATFAATLRASREMAPLLDALTAGRISE